MRVLKVSKDGQFVRENGDFVWLEGKDAVQQMIRQFLLTIKGEVYIDDTLGVDYKNRIFPKSSSNFARYLEIKRVIMTVPGVQKVLQMEFITVNQAKREYKIIADIQGDLGFIEFNEVL